MIYLRRKEIETYVICFKRKILCFSDTETCTQNYGLRPFSFQVTIHKPLHLSLACFSDTYTHLFRLMIGKNINKYFIEKKKLFTPTPVRFSVVPVIL